ncbi:MAG TPA: hypothetical protein VMV18_04295 [bacterium]|nr:hypothetical protein [bacterium]
MRRFATPLFAVALAMSAGACLEEKPAATAGASGGSTASTAAAAASASGTPGDPDVASLKKSTGGGWKDFYILSPEDSQTEDPTLALKLVKISKLRKGRIGIVLALENHREDTIDAAQIGGSLVDGDERTMPVIARPADKVAPDGTQNLVWIFDATDAAKGSLEMRLDIPGTKTWPVVFSKEKPPDFKPTPNPQDQQGGPGAPGMGGPPGY